MAKVVYSATIMPRIFLAPLLLVTLLLTVGAPSLVPAAVAQEGEDAALTSLLAGDGGLRLAGRSLDREALTKLYAARDYRPIWLAAPEREAALVRALSGAAAHGIDPAAFSVPAASPEERELLLTDAFLRYAMALAQGRVRSSAIESDWALPAPAFDVEATLDRAASGDPEMVLAGLAPLEPAYQRLQAALVRYRAIVAAGGWPRGKDDRVDVSLLERIPKPRCGKPAVARFVENILAGARKQFGGRLMPRRIFDTAPQAGRFPVGQPVIGLTRHGCPKVRHRHACRTARLAQANSI